MSVVHFNQRHVAGTFLRRPSPSVWRGCRHTLLNDLGLGNYIHADFLGAPASAAVLSSMVFDGFSVAADTDTVASMVAGRFGGVLDLETDGDDNDAWALFTEPFATIELMSGKKMWFEVDLELGDVAMDGGMFFGFMEEADLGLEAVADDAGAVATGDYVGFKIIASNPDAVDAVIRLEANAEIVVATDITNSTSLPEAERASLVNDTPHRFGLRFDGNDQMEWFVDGQRVARRTITADLDPVNIDMGAIVSLKTGAIAAESAAMGFIRAAFQEST